MALRALVRAGVGEEGGEFVGRREEADGVERDAAEEGGVVGQGGGLGVGAFPISRG
jgi:hypothetical protein